ncbi:MAG: hypothetical protein K8I60_20695, partial [Anaerolineae bacterium]|nr:hypothetical protein [Anaerolineae bacterium]
PHDGAVQQPSIAEGYGVRDLPILATVDVADVSQERSAHYRWSNQERLPGFPTEVREFSFIGCDCVQVDSGRLINGEESFDLGGITPGTPLLLVTRLHPMNAGTFSVYVNDEFIARRWIPELPGIWLDVPTLIPADVATDPLHIRIVPDVPGGFYMPYFHTIYDARNLPAAALPESVVSTFQDGAIVLADATLDYQPDAAQLRVGLDWYTAADAQGDYKVFIHVLDESGTIRAQADGRPGGGTLPPGNWLPGGFHDDFVVNLADTPPGRYRVVMGMYDPITNERSAPTGGDNDQRLGIGEVEISVHG